MDLDSEEWDPVARLTAAPADTEALGAQAVQVDSEAAPVASEVVPVGSEVVLHLLGVPVVPVFLAVMARSARGAALHRRRRHRRRLAAMALTIRPTRTIP